MTAARRVASLLVMLLLIAPSQIVLAQIVATYLGNEGVLITYKSNKILFDPLYRNDYGRYQLVPSETESAIFAGTPPFDDVRAVFVSHHHGDHFSAADMARLLAERPQLRLYAPAQAVAELLSLLPERTSIMQRVVGIELDYGDPPAIFSAGDLTVSAVRIPHSGWPTAMTDVQNIAFRVTFGSAATVAHFGDADTSDAHYARDAEHWAEQQIDIAFPPYWYFTSAKGRQVLAARLKPRYAVGLHVPVKMPDERGEWPPEYRDYDLFTEPGQSRRITIED